MSEPEPVRQGWRHALAFERVLALIFVMLGVVLSLLIAVYWLAVLEPTLRADAESHSRVLAQAQAHKIEGLLGGDLPARRLLDELNTVLDEILLVKDQSNGEPLTPRIELMLDPDLLRGRRPSRRSVGWAERERCPSTQPPRLTAIAGWRPREEDGHRSRSAHRAWGVDGSRGDATPYRTNSAKRHASRDTSTRASGWRRYEARLDPDHRSRGRIGYRARSGSRSRPSGRWS